MIAAFHRLRRDEDGQALLLGAVLLLVLALAMAGIGSLGVRVHDRIALQDGADAAAYSLAVEEARAFNLYAWTNRAQIAQYVTILQLLSLDAMVLGLLVGMGNFAAVAKTVGSLCEGPKRPVCAAIPVIGTALALVSGLLERLEPLIVQAGRAILAFDLFVGEVAVPLLVGANLFLFANQAAAHARVLGSLTGDEALRIASVALPDVRWAAPVQALNVARFEKAHLPEAMALWGDDREGARLEDGPAGRRNWARRGMSELIHASRHDFWIYDRTFPDSLSHLLGNVPGIDAVETFLDLLPIGKLRGHTRLLSLERPSPARSEAIYEGMEKHGYGNARYPTGNALGANFYFDPGGSLLGPLMDAFGLQSIHMASVTSASPASGGGWACTWDVKKPYRSVGVDGVLAIYAPRLSCDIHRGSHPWWGITPHMAFNAPGDGCDRFENEFCQPDVWVAVQQGEDGPRAVARAQAYYHRPGNWQEPPNFFNPFWRARLAPVEPGLERLGVAGAAVRALLELP